MTGTAAALRTPLYDAHVAAGAQMVEFGGWMMPLQYSSMRTEHLAVRNAAGIFDVSHMGEFEVDGSDATQALERLVSNRVADLADGQARYNIICDASGGIIDDTLVYRISADRHLVVVNAGPREKDRAHFEAEGLKLDDATMRTALLAVQGPRAIEILQPLADFDLESVEYYHHREGRFADIPARFSRTGYTGEDGFELFLPWDSAARAWQLIIDAGAPHGLVPCGLGARDTLRLEAAMRLSGQDIDASTNPLEAGLGWAVKLDKGDFIGRDVLQRIKDAGGPARILVGLELEGRAIARHGHPVAEAGRAVGEVTSGTYSFTLGKAVAMGYVERGSADSTDLTVEVRGEQVPARRVPLPFYKRPKTN
ncbi:MAG TPA: glycine cleavage system aminomethyltransferase GcvT [Candidatus Dormibacteraeota bacterium]|nr:glycine cleavage system aminomethyltransferase GcvT [Candidatus Dormibacteraeota bacterium]